MTRPEATPPSPAFESKASLRRRLDGQTAEIRRLEARLAGLEARERDWEAEKARLEAAAARGNSSSVRVHASYLKRLSQQTDSTLLLSDTVNSILGAVKEISSSYKEMLKAVHEVGSICHLLNDSFEIQTRAQDSIVVQVEAADQAAAGEVKKSQALKGDLGQLEGIRDFMSQAVDTIDEISARLSLLSMNGRIEAAHAGSFGAGFTVVAQEMLRLQQESQRVIASQKTQLAGFLPLMAAMQEKADAVEAQAKVQQASIQDITRETQVIHRQNQTNNHHVSGLTASVDELAASIEEGERTTQIIDRETVKVEKIFKEEVYVSKKMNDLDRFIFDISQRSRSLAEASHQVINEYQRVSVLNGISYVWQGESWLVTDRKNLPEDLRSRPGTETWGDRLLVCIGQTDNNPAYPRPLAAGAGILDLQPLSELQNPRGKLQGFQFFLSQAGISFQDLQQPGRIADPLRHCTMSCIDTLTGSYRQVLEPAIREAGLVCAFSFGGVFYNGDVVVNHFLSVLPRFQSDAVKFSLLGESLILSLQEHVEGGRLWK